MKTFLTLICFFHSLTIFASYSKPKLVARFNSSDHFNSAPGISCYSSDPLAAESGVFLSCKDSSGDSILARFRPEFEVLAKSNSSLFSRPVELNSIVSWYEFNESQLNTFFEFESEKLKQKKLRDLGPLSSLIDSFLPIKNGFYIYRLQDDDKSFNLWKDDVVSSLFKNSSSHLFPPMTNENGEFIFKRRQNHLSENAPDDLILWDGEFKTILKDRDSDPQSIIKSFRHQYSFDQEGIALVVTDDRGEVLVIVKNGALNSVVRVGQDVGSLDYFSPKLRNGLLVFRGNDLEGRKTLWVYENGNLKRLLTQGDVVQTDKGPARVDYNSRDAVFFSSAGVSKNGDVYFQAALTDIDSPRTILGIGLLAFYRE